MKNATQDNENPVYDVDDIEEVVDLLSKSKNSTNISNQEDYVSKYNYHEAMRDHQCKRTEIVTNILHNYKTQQEERNKSKNKYKKKVLILLLVLISFLTAAIITWVILFFCLDIKTPEALVAFISSVVTYLVSLLSMLTVIVKYLFPEDEDRNFNSLVSSIIENDTARIKNDNDFETNSH